MKVFKSFDILLKNECFLGFEDKKYVNSAIIGAEKSNSFIKGCLNFYKGINNLKKYKTLPIPKIIINLLKEKGLSKYGTQNIGKRIFLSIQL